MMTKPMWDYMSYYKSIDTMMSWKKIIYKADVSTRLFQIGMWIYFEIFRDRELSLVRSDSRVHISVL